VEDESIKLPLRTKCDEIGKKAGDHWGRANEASISFRNIVNSILFSLYPFGGVAVALGRSPSIAEAGGNPPQDKDGVIFFEMIERLSNLSAIWTLGRKKKKEEYNDRPTHIQVAQLVAQLGCPFQGWRGVQPSHFSSISY